MIPGFPSLPKRQQGPSFRDRWSVLKAAGCHVLYSRGLQSVICVGVLCGVLLPLGLQSYLLRFGMTGPEHGTHLSPTFETKVRLEP